MTWIRIAALMFLGTSTSGCWLSNTNLIGPTDWAEVDLLGAYTIEEIGESTKVSFEPRSDKAVLMKYLSSRGEETQFIFFVPVPETPDGWYLMGMMDA